MWWKSLSQSVIPVPVASGIGATSATITWDAIDGATNYAISVSQNSGPYTPIADTVDLTYQLTALDPESSYEAKVIATVVSDGGIVAFATPASIFPIPVNKILISGGMTSSTYAPDFGLNPSGGPAVFRGVIKSGFPSGRTYSGLDLLVGALGTATPDQFTIAFAEVGLDYKPEASAWTEVTYPDSLSYYQPPTPTTIRRISGGWFHRDMAVPAAGLDNYISYSVRGAGLGNWIGSASTGSNSWPTSQQAPLGSMSLDTTLTGAFTDNWLGVVLGAMAWSWDISGNPVYNLAVVGDSTFNGVQPLGSANELSIEGAFYHANLDEIDNGMRWICSCWGNGAYTMDEYLDRGRSTFDMLTGRAQVYVIQSWTYNQTPTSHEECLAQQAVLLAFKADAEAAGYRVIFAIIHPQGTPRKGELYDASYDEMVAWTLDQGGIATGSVLEDPENPRQFLPAYAEDQVHINGTGAAAAGPVISAALTAALTTMGAFE